MRPAFRIALEQLAAAGACVTLVGCSQLSFGRTVPVPVSVAVDTTPTRTPWVAPPAAAATRSDDSGTTRLRRFAAVWTAARWFHPDALRQVGAWDSAYLRYAAIARVAANDAAFASAVQDMLGELHDAETRVVGDTTIALRNQPVAAVLQRTGDSLIIARPVHVAIDGVVALSEQLGPGFATAAPRSAAVLDLRADSGLVNGARWWNRQMLDDEYPLPDGVLLAPSRQRAQHAHPGGDATFDPPPVRASVTRACCLQWLTTSGEELRVARVGADERSDRPLTDTAVARRVSTGSGGFAPPLTVVLVNDATIVPAPLFTLHAAGQLTFVSTGTGVLRSDAHGLYIPIGGGFHARLRTEALQLSDGRSVAAYADTVLADGGGPRPMVPDSTDRAVQLALAIARGTARVAARPLAPATRATQASLSPEQVSEPYPSLPERLLAVTKLWGTVRAFNPYLPMADESWDDMFDRALGDVEVAASARDYSSALMRFVATLDASQADVRVRDHQEFGARPGAVPFSLRLVDRRPLVVAIDDSVAQRSGVRVGDEILAIGGEPIDKRLVRWRELVSASNEWSRDQQLESWLEAGPSGAISTFRIRAAGGAITDREFRYGARAEHARDRSTSTRLIEALSNGVVRITLGADTTRSSNALPAAVAEARALIVDVRGVRDSASLPWLAGSVLDADRRAYARDDRSVLHAPPHAALRTPELDPARQFMRAERTTPPAPADAFTGPMAILVDATTSGDGELIALRLLTGGVNRVLVGSQTAGAVGETAVLSLPGDVRVRIPVSDVRYPDGRFIQRLGLTPNVSVTPSVDGVRAGRDEVLEAAQRWISQQLAPPPARRR